MMKRMLCLLLCLLMTLSLCACGAKESEKPANMQSTLPSAGSAAEEPEETEAPLSEAQAALEKTIQTVRKLKNRPVSELYDAIGEPKSEDAAPSCMGDGEDVNLYYEGFTVYTYRDGDKQTVVDVELNP